ncbi:helix-turn-helix domain-containing protein [Streptomyces rhizosphaerihabitans]|uniref:helix-turn-helix domain-containing protein n=1 Tax=Streptomyces rhizosphaerihabitans TaxID=1266770 RepID=UPI0021BF062A|nr:helix-turn-helix domain-containing protein [Streptomyces rhizosphaerihabitans]MCT9006895.1 helix-turn-helix domain-containing protein [Streptomyces rhizosphaerihabitans]
MAELTTGQRVARARRRLGWDQTQLAASVDRSVSWVSKIETGRLPLDRMSVLGQIAEVLGVEVIELTGQPYRHETAELDSGHAAIPGLRLALQQATMPGGAALIAMTDAPTLPELASRVEAAERLRQDAKFTPLGDVLPQILRDLVVLCDVAEGEDVPRAESLMLRASHMARVSSNLLGHHDLGWSAVQRELVAAERAESPILRAAARWDLCGVWLHEGELGAARDMAHKALDDLEPHMGAADQTLRALWGAMHLRAAVAWSRLWDRTEAESHLTEARQAAAGVSANGNAFQTQFNAVNAEIHSVEVSLELGHPRDVLSRAELVDIEHIASGERQSHFWVCTAVGQMMNGKLGPAADAILRADAIAPQHVRNRPIARNLVDDLRSTDKHAHTAEIRRLAASMKLG